MDFGIRDSKLWGLSQNLKVHGDPDKKNEIFVKYWSLYLQNTDCKTVRPNATEYPLSSSLKYKKMKRKTQIMHKFIFIKKLGMLFKNRKHIRTRHFLALQINTKQMFK